MPFVCISRIQTARPKIGLSLPPHSAGVPILDIRERMPALPNEPDGKGNAEVSLRDGDSVRSRRGFDAARAFLPAHVAIADPESCPGRTCQPCTRKQVDSGPGCRPLTCIRILDILIHEGSSPEYIFIPGHQS